MSVPSSHILPSSAFRHVGVMVFFMSIMASFCALGFVSVHDITKGWIIDIENSLSLEIPSYDSETKTVISEVFLEQNLNIIKRLLENDPIILDTDIIKNDSLILSDINDLTIPAPIFVTVYLRPDRAVNAENRIINNIQNTIPQIIIKSPESWEKDIVHAAIMLKFVFGGLALSVFLVTSIILSGIVKSQINANVMTIELIHLMGASPSKIATLFKTTIFKSTIFGLIAGLGIAILALSPLISILDLNDNLLHFYYYIIGIFAVFIILTRMMTHITVISTLSRLP